MAQLAAAITPMWATRTWEARSSILRRLLDFMDKMHPDLQQLPLGAKMALFVLSTNTKPSSKLTYLSSLRSLTRRLGLPATPLLDLVGAGLTVRANAMTPVQAPPATPNDLARLSERAWRTDKSGKLPMNLYVMWKSASRWDDLCHLQKNNFLEFTANPSQVVIEWAQLKTNRQQRFRSTGFTVIQEDTAPLTIQVLQRVVSKMTKNEMFTSLTSTQLRHWLRQDPATAHLTCHSFKRGALDVALERAVQGLFNPRLLPLLAKHQDPLMAFPSSTIRYASNKPALARMLGTQEVTRHL